MFKTVLKGNIMRTTRELKTALGIALLFLTTLPTYAQGGFVPPQNITKGTANNQVARRDDSTDTNAVEANP
jgi:hypothetical protein